MTPFIIPQVFLIKPLIREIFSRGTAGSGCVIIVNEINYFYLFINLFLYMCVGGSVSEREAMTRFKYHFG